MGAILVGDLAVVGYLVCGWGDSAGELAGRNFGRMRYGSPFGRGSGNRRSVEGSAAVFMAGTLGAVVALLMLGTGLKASVVTGLACGLVGAGAEALSSQGADNFWVQLLPSLTAWWLVVRIAA
jgi:dolichol kinase